jgi:hypothetical protein
MTPARGYHADGPDLVTNRPDFRHDTPREQRFSLNHLMVQLTSACVLLGGASALVNLVISLTYSDSLVERIKRDDAAFSCTSERRRGGQRPKRAATSAPDPLSWSAARGAAGVPPATGALGAEGLGGESWGFEQEGRGRDELVSRVAGAGGGEGGDGAGDGGSVSQGGGRGRGILDLSLNLSLDDSNLTEKLIHGEDPPPC